MSETDNSLNEYMGRIRGMCKCNGQGEEETEHWARAFSYCVCMTAAEVAAMLKANAGVTGKVLFQDDPDEEL